MRLVLREYLAMLRESGELDTLLPDLMLAMGFDPLTRPATGVRQFGVDLPAVGVDPDDPSAGNKLFLMTVKRGNIGRAEWNGSLQAVRPSLEEILDSYLRMMVQPEHAALPKKIVLVTGGDLKQEAAIDWANYIQSNRSRYPQYGTIEFAFWGGDKLAQLLDEYLFDEFLFPEAARRQLRKTIAIADQADEEPRHFYEMIADVFEERNLPTGRSTADQRLRRKAFHLVELSLLVVYRWCEDANNLRTAILAAERTLLTAWDWMRRAGLLSHAPTRGLFDRLAATYRRIVLAFSDKVRAHAQVRDGLAIADDIENSLRVHELVGILGVLTCALFYAAEREPEPVVAEELTRRATDVAQILAETITNNAAAAQPRFDSHAIELGIGLVALTFAGPAKSADEWLSATAARVLTAVKANRHYPISTDRYEDLLALRGPNPPPWTKFFDLSTLIPTVAEWMILLNLREPYLRLRREVAEAAPDTDLQLWFPDANSDEQMYRANAGIETGATLTSLELPDDPDVLRERIRRVYASRDWWAELSCLREGWPWGALLASRHFRTPLVPALWQAAIVDG
jgi:hypothetical protein